MINFRLLTLVSLALLAAEAGCGGGHHAATTTSSANITIPTVPPGWIAAPPATATPPLAAVPCAIGPQAPPSGTIEADFATALAFAPDGRLFFAERSGAVRVFQDGQVHTFATVRTVTTEADGGYSERGLLGLAIDPRFGENRLVYAVYSDADLAHQDVVRWTDCGGVGGAATILIRFPSGADCCHKGGRLAFGPDGKLYVTLGEEHTAPAAQDTADVRGKVLRYNPDGTVPSDNPFGAGNPVWAYGFRNPFGLAFSSTGQLAVTSNGPTGEIPGGPTTGYDTVVTAVARGRGYQWPNCYGYSHPLLGASCGTGQPGPDWSSENKTVVPTGAAFVDASGPPGYAGHLVFCTFAAGLKILTVGSPATLADGPPDCRLDVKQGPDHAVYYSDPAHIYRLA